MLGLRRIVSASTHLPGPISVCKYRKVWGSLHYPFRALAVWFCHLIDNERLEIQNLVKEQLHPLAISDDILSQEVSGIPKLLAMFDMRPQAPFINRAFSAAKDHGDLAYP